MPACAGHDSTPAGTEAVREALKILELQLKEVTLARLTPRRQGTGLAVPSQGC